MSDTREHPEIPAVEHQGDPLPPVALSPEGRQLTDLVNQRYKELSAAYEERWKPIAEKHGIQEEALAALKRSVKEQFTDAAAEIARMATDLKAFERTASAAPPSDPVDEFDGSQDYHSQAVNTALADRSDPRNKPEYKAAVNAWLRASNNGSRGVAVAEPHFSVLQAAANYVADQIREQGDPTNALSTDFGPSGGFFARPSFELAVDRQLIETSPTRAYATVRSVNGFQHVGILRNTNLDASRTGSETGVRTVDTENGRYTEYTIDLHEMYVYPAISYKAQQIPGMDLERELLDDAGLEFGQQEGTDTTSGTGVGEAHGFMTDTNVQEIDSSVASTISTGDCINLMYGTPSGGSRINPAHRRAGMFALSAGAIATLILEENGVGNRIWQPATTGGQPSLLHGRPWDEWPDMDAVATDGYPVLYADFRRFYRMAIKPGLFVVRVENPPLSQIHISRYVGGRVWDWLAAKKLKVT